MYASTIYGLMILSHQAPNQQHIKVNAETTLITKNVTLLAAVPDHAITTSVHA